jgi:hypothetical protein
LRKLHKSNNMKVVNFISRDIFDLDRGKHKMLAM